jgi:hypothetical protein
MTGYHARDIADAVNTALENMPVRVENVIEGKR